jgi:L-iditol 2-dehydrogenase
MRVAMYYSNSDVRIEDQPKPKIGADEFLLRVEASGICGSDVMEWYRKDKVPLVLGHEVAGVIEEVGDSVKNFNVGDNVAVTHHVPCFSCHYCDTGHESVCETLQKNTHFYPGGFAEYVRVPAINVDRGTFPIPDGVSFDEASFTEPLACVLRGQNRAHLHEGQTVLVAGSGISGLMHINLASSRKASNIIAMDTIDYRLDVAKKLGANETISNADDLPNQVRELNNGKLADVVIICYDGFIEQALESVESGGTVLFFAGAREGQTIPQSINDLFWRREVTLTSSYAGGPQDCTDALELIRSGAVNAKAMISHKLPFNDIQKGFQLVSQPWKQYTIKIIVEPQI